MKTVYIDCIGGVSGDMLLGALVDSGVSQVALKEKLSELNLPGFALDFFKVEKVGISATQAKVKVSDETTERHVPEIIHLIEVSSIASNIKKRSVRIFNRIGHAEAKVHGSSIEKIHLHELGGIDTIVDVVGVLIGFDLLNVDKVICSPLPLARGFIDSAHGRLPLPAPATLGLLAGVPVMSAEVTGELVTPTGAALVTELANEFGELPSVTIESTGYGAGERNRKIPNVVRLIIGDHVTKSNLEELLMLQTNIDDMNPEIYDYVSGRLYKAGALEVFTQSAGMKKGRPGILLSVLASRENAEDMRRIILQETTTLGVREFSVQRHSLPRNIHSVETKYGTIQVKAVDGLDYGLRYAPEHDDCVKAAQESGVSLQIIYREALISASAYLGKHQQKK